MVRKYPEVKEGYWVYSIKVPSINKYYIGISKCKKCSRRWRKATYKTTVLKEYLNEWDSMIKTVLIDGLSKEESFMYEGKIIDALSMNDLCINKQRSGLIRVSDINAYQRELLKNNTEYRERQKQRAKQYHECNKNNPEYQERQKQRAKQYYERNKEKIKEKRRQRYQKKKLEKQQQTSLPLS